MTPDPRDPHRDAAQDSLDSSQAAWSSPGPAPESGLTTQQALRFLSLGLQDRRRPVDQLVDRLHQADGEPWLRVAVVTGLRPGLAPADLLLGDAQPSLDQLKELKKAGQRMFKGGKDEDARLTGLASYCLSLAGGLVHHGQLLSSQDPEVIAELMDSLAAVLPGEWARLVERAAERLRPAKEDGGSPR